jgi:hypothetical protein
MARPQKRSEKPLDACGVGGCYNPKIAVGLFCSKHWALCQVSTQTEFCSLYLKPETEDHSREKAINALELKALGEIAASLEAAAQKGKAK